MMTGNDGWCREGRGQGECVRYHVREHVPALPRPSGSDRECTRCHKPLSINPGTKGQWCVWSCDTGCDPADVRADLLGLGIDPRCLGNYGSAPWVQNQARKAKQRPAESADPVVYAAANRSHAMLKLASSDLGSAALLKMCLQAISEGDGSLPGDPVVLLPRNYAEFMALAERTGIERTYRYRLARSYLCKKGA